MRRPFLALPVLLALVVGVFVGPSTTGTATAADPEPSGSVGGTLTLPDGDVTQVTVLVMRRQTAARWQTVREARPDADGRWHVDELAPGPYRIGYATRSDLVGTFYGTQDATSDDVETAPAVDVVVGAETLTDVVAPLGGALRLTYPHLNQSPGIFQLVAQQADGTWRTARTSLASYPSTTTLRGLAPGSYRLVVHANRSTGGGPAHTGLWWTTDGFSADPADAGTLEVTHGQTLEAKVEPLPVRDLVQPLVRPSLQGDAQPGGTLRAMPGRWPDGTVVVEHQWYRADDASSGSLVAIPGALGATLAITDDLVGYSVRHATTVEAPGRDRTVHWTAAQRVTRPFASAPRLSIASPRVGGSAQATLDGVWSTRPFAIDYVWRIDGIVLSRSASLFLAHDYAGQTLELTATASGVDFRQTRLTAATMVVGATRTLRARPVLQDVRVGLDARLRLDPGGTFDPPRGSERPRRSVQWLADGRALAGATGTSLRITPVLLGRRLSVRVTESEPGFDDAVVTTRPVVVARGRFDRTWRPYIAGRFKPGRVVRAWHHAPTPRPTALRYRWYLDGKAIQGATSKQLRLTRAMRGRALRVDVTPVRPGYELRAVRSPSRRVNGNGWWP